MIATAGRRVLANAEKLVADVADDRFARLPTHHGQTVESNHPAWVFGHLCLYPTLAAQMVGDADAAGRLAPPDHYPGLFAARSSVCRDDVEGTIYPPKAELVAALVGRFTAVLDLVEATAADAFEADNPVERMRGWLPTAGAGCVYVLGPHMMFHLGQVSAWRRVEGLEPAT